MLQKVMMPDSSSKIDRNPSITVAARKGPSVSRLTWRSVHFGLPNLAEIPEVSLVTRQES